MFQVTRIVLPGMKKRKHSAIVNIGSAAATVAPSGPLYAVYAGTKVRSPPPLPTGVLSLLLLLLMGRAALTPAFKYIR